MVKKDKQPKNKKGLDRPGKKAPFIVRGDSFDFRFADYWNSEKAEKLSKALNKKRTTISATEQSYRVINHWDEKGVIDSDQDTEGGWRRFSILELIWIRIVSELRKFGMPLKKIKNLRDVFYEGENANYQKTVFEFYVSLALHGDDCVYVVLPEGLGEFATKAELDQSLSMGFIKEGFVSVYLNFILQDILQDTNIDIDNPAMRIELDKKEAALLEDVRKGDFKEVKVVLNNGAVERIESLKTHDWSLGKFKEIVSEHDYQNIRLIRKDGEVVKIEQTKQSKP